MINRKKIPYRVYGFIDGRSEEKLHLRKIPSLDNQKEQIGDEEDQINRHQWQ